jgi:hypothetical protein
MSVTHFPPEFHPNGTTASTPGSALVILDCPCCGMHGTGILSQDPAAFDPLLSAALDWLEVLHEDLQILKQVIEERTP